MFPLRITSVAFAALLAAGALARPLPVDGAVPNHVERRTADIDFGRMLYRRAGNDHPQAPAGHPGDHPGARKAQIDAAYSSMTAAQSALRLAQTTNSASTRENAAELASQLSKTSVGHALVHVEHKNNPATAPHPEHSKQVAAESINASFKSWMTTERRL